MSKSVITKDPDILGGAPVFRGTHVPFRWLFDYLEANQTLDVFLDAYPSVTRGAAIHALECAKSLVLAAAAIEDDLPEGGLGTEIAALFPKNGPDFVAPELRFTMQNPFEPLPKRARGRPPQHKPSRSRRKKRA